MQTLWGQGNGTSMNESNKRMPPEYYTVYKEEDQRISKDLNRQSETEQRINIEILLFDFAFGPLF